MTARESVEFFARKIEQQAQSENVLLSDVEKRMLRFSEIEPDGVNDRQLCADFDREYDMDNYEQKIGDLLVRAYERDKYSPNELDQYPVAKSALGDHDYYIWFALWRIFPESRPGLPPRTPSSLQDNLIYLAVAFAVVAVLLYFVLNRIH